VTLELSPHDQALVEAVALRVVELLDEREQQPGQTDEAAERHEPQSQLVDATTLARILGVARSTVYDRAAELGAIEVGMGAKPRLRFDVEQARAAWTRRVSREESQLPEAPVLAEVRRRRRRSASASRTDLLPVKPLGGSV